MLCPPRVECAQWLVQGMEQASYDAVAAHWKCIRAVLSVDDSLRLRRVAMVLGDPLIGTVAAGAGLSFIEGIGYITFDVELPSGCVQLTSNVHDHAGQSTYCAGCGALLIGRDWYQLDAWSLDEDGACRQCARPLAGRFAAKPGTWGPQRRRLHIA